MKKTAAAILAFAAMTGTAFAESSRPVENTGAVLEKIYDAMDESRAQALDSMMANAQNRVDEQLASLEEPAEPATTITVASN